jgi:hypothetical protein
LNLTRKKARVSLIASLTTALVASGGLLALSAHAAPTPLTLNTGGESPVVANLGYATDAAAGTAYALKITNADAAAAMTLKQVSGPTTGTIAYQRKTSNAAATAASMLTIGTNEVQTLTKTGTFGTGDFTLTFAGEATDAILHDATGATIQAELEELDAVETGDVRVTGGASGPWVVTFRGQYAHTNVGALVVTPNFAGGTTPGISVTETTAGAAVTPGVIAAPVATTDLLYVTGDVPGTYTFRFFQDSNGNGNIDADDERATPLITMTVLDAGGIGTTTTTADDVAPVLAATTPITQGVPITAEITYNKDLSVTDARGTLSTGSLKAKLAALTFMDLTVGNGLASLANATEQAVTYSATTGSITYAAGTPTDDGSITLRADLKISGAADNATYGTKTIQVTDNGATDISLEATLVDGKVVATGNAVTVKSGTAAVTYEATAIDDQGDGSVGAAADNDTPVSGVVVYFTLGGDNVDDLTTDGTAVTGQPTVFTATTNSDGIAKLKVTSTATDDTDSYTVDADTNAAPNITALTATYEDAAADAIELTSTAAELTPEITATSVALKGKLLDQFEAAFQPPSNQSQQVGIQIPDGTDFAFAQLTNGAFTYNYAPTTTPTAGTSLTFDFTYGSLVDGDTEGGTINWASSTVPASVTVSTPRDEATSVNLSDYNTIAPGQANALSTDFGSATAEITGTVLDSTSAALAFKRVTLMGSDGVWFSDSATGTELKTSIDVVTNSSGQYSGAYAFFTKSGTATITATAGTVSKEVSMETDDSADAFKVIAIDAEGTPGATLVVTGKVTDFFGNPVTGTTVNLSTGSSTIGTLADTAPETNSEGVWSTTFVSGSNQSGDVTLTATLAGQTANKEPIDDWTDEDGAGLTGLPEHGEYTDQATIKIEEEIVTLEATAVVVGGGRAFLSGTTRANANVDIYIKPLGQSTFALFDVVKADAEGEFGTSKNIVRSTLWLAKVGDLSSTVELTSVQSKVTLGTRALGGGRVVLAADGAPNARATLRFYQVMSDGKLKLIRSLGANSKGYGSFIWKTTPGAKKIRVYYQAPGTRRGQAEKIQNVT